MSNFAANNFFIKSIRTANYPLGFNLTFSTTFDYYAWKSPLTAVKNYWHKTPLNILLNDSYGKSGEGTSSTRTTILTIDLKPRLLCPPLNPVDYPNRFASGNFAYMIVNCIVVDYKFTGATYTIALSRTNTLESISSSKTFSAATIQLVKF